MPPEKVETGLLELVAKTPMTAVKLGLVTVIVPELLMPPEKFETASTMTARLVAETVPLLTMPPPGELEPNCET